MTTDDSVFEWVWACEDEGYWDASIGDHEVASIVSRDDDGWELHRVLGEYNLGTRHIHESPDAAKAAAERLVRERVAEMAQAMGLLPAPLAGRPLSKRERLQAMEGIVCARRRIREALSDRHEHTPRRIRPSMRAELHAVVRHEIRHIRALRLALAADDALRAQKGAR